MNSRQTAGVGGDVSLGQEPARPESVAVLLLATLLESNAPRTYAAGLTPERGRGERYVFAVAGDATSRWLVTIDADHSDAQRSSAPAEVTITGSAADLALVVYGRRELSGPSRSGAVRLEGDPTLADRFARIVPRP